MIVKLRKSLGMLAVFVTFLYSGWIAFVGLHSNYLRIRSAMFPVSGTATVYAALGVLGVASCVILLGYPRRGGIGATAAMAGAAATHLYTLADKYSFEFLRSLLVLLTLPLLLATVICLIYALGQIEERTTSGNSNY